MVQRTTDTFDDSAWVDLFIVATHGELGGAHVITALDGPLHFRIEGGTAADGSADKYWGLAAYSAGPPVEGASELPENGVHPIVLGPNDRINKIRVRAVPGGSARASLSPMKPGRS